MTRGTELATNGHFRVPELSYPVSSVNDTQNRTAREVAMSTTITSLDQIDLDISVAYIALGAARTAFERCPSGENALGVDAAESSLNALLDARLAVTR